jgi:hypothetical protein
MSRESCKGMDARRLQDRDGCDEITVLRTMAGCASPRDRPFSARTVDFVSRMGTKSTGRPIHKKPFGAVKQSHDGVSTTIEGARTPGFARYYTRSKSLSVIRTVS